MNKIMLALSVAIAPVFLCADEPTPTTIPEDYILELQLPVPTEIPVAAPAKLPVKVEAKETTKVRDFKVGDYGWFGTDLIYVDKNMGVWLIDSRKVIKEPPFFFSYAFAKRLNDGWHVELYPDNKGKYREWEPGDYPGSKASEWGWIPAKSVKIRTLEERKIDLERNGQKP